MRNHHVVVLCTLCAALPAFSQNLADFTDVKVKESFKAVLTADPFLMGGAVDVKEVGGKRYLISVGVTVNKSAQEPDNPKAKIDTMKVASLKAKAEIVKFIESKVATETRIDSVSETVTTSDERSKERFKRVTKVIQDVTVERARQLLTRVEPIGSWYSADNKLYYSAVAMSIDSASENP